MAQSRPFQRADLLAWGLIALGLVLRLRQYLFNRSLWLDEAMLALNIIEKDLSGLFGKLDYNQGAPLGFLLLEKLVATLLGSGERALRLLPLLAGCASLVLFYVLARKLLSAPGMLVALALFAVSPTLIYYSSEVKQYSFDVLVALVLLWLAQAALRSFSFPLLVVGAISLWFSHPALFILAAIGVVLLIHARQKPLPVLAMGGVWVASFALLYFASLRGLSSNQFLLGYWDEYFMPIPPSASWLATSLVGLFSNPGGVPVLGAFLLIATVLGSIFLFKTDWKNAALLLLPFLFALAASAAGKYPFAGRMMLFAAPLLYLFLAAAVDWTSSLSLRPRLLTPLLALALAGLYLVAPTLDSAEKFITPKTPEHIRPALAVLKESYKPSDHIYVYAWALPAYRYYAPRFGLESVQILAGEENTLNPQQTLSDLDTLQGRDRVWVLFSHVYARNDFNERDYILAYLDQIGAKKRQFIEPGSSVYLYLYDLK